MPKSKKPTTIQFSDYIKTSEQQGSNLGGFFIHKKTGKEYYIKWLPEHLLETEIPFFQVQDLEKGKYKDRHRNRFNNEVLAARIYELYGVSVPKMEFITFVDEKGVTNYGIASEKKDDIMPLDQTGQDFDQVRNKAQEDFLIDVLLSNYDAVGGSMDNLFYDSRTKDPFRIDPGAALRYYAQGKPKKGEFNAKVGEYEDMETGRQINTQFHPGILENAGIVFKGVSDSPALLISLRKLLAVTDEQLKACVENNGFDIDDTGKGQKKNMVIISQLLERKQSLIAKAESKILNRLMNGLKSTVERRDYLQKAGISQEDITKICLAIDQNQPKNAVGKLIQAAQTAGSKLDEKQIMVLKKQIGNDAIVKLISRDKLVNLFAKNIPESEFQHFLQFLENQPVSTYTQYLKDTSAIHTDEKLAQYLKSVYKIYVNNKGSLPLKHAILTDEQKTIIHARSTWNNIVSHCFQDNKDEMAKKENGVRESILKKIKALDPENPHPEQTYERIVSFVKEHSTIIFSFELTPDKLGKIDTHRMLNYFEKTSFTHKGYEENRNKVEKNMFGFFNGKRGIESFNKLAAPRYAALVFLDADNTLDEGIASVYGKSYAVFSPKMKSQAIYYPSDSMNDLVQDIKYTPSTLQYFEILLSQMDYERFLNLLLKVEYNQPLNQELFSTNYIESHLPSINLLNSEFVSHIHISERELSQLPSDFKETFEITGITMTHGYDGPYQKMTRELYNSLDDPSKVQAIISKFPAVLLTADKEGLTPLEKAVELGARETVEEFLKYKEYISFQQLNKALTIADKNENKKLAELLIKNGANRKEASLIEDRKSNKNLSPKFPDFISYISHMITFSDNKQNTIRELSSEHKNFIIRDTNGELDDIILWLQGYSTSRPKTKIEGKEPLAWAIENNIEVKGIPILLYAAQLNKKLLNDLSSRQAIFAVEGKDLILWAMEHDKKLGESSPLQWAIENDLPIERKLPLDWLKSAIIQKNNINGKPIINWAVENKIKIHNKDFLEWAVEEKLIDGSQMMDYIEKKKSNYNESKDKKFYMSNRDGISLSCIINGLNALDGKGAIILRMPAAVWLCIKHPDGKVEKINGNTVIPNLSDILKGEDITEQQFSELSTKIYEKYQVNLLTPSDFEAKVEKGYNQIINDLKNLEEGYAISPRLF